MTTSNDYIFKFISGKYQGGEFPVSLNTEIRIGRGADLEMVLVEDMVSRRHARITTHGGEFVIEDLGSTNGTFVNGEKISRRQLTDGDRVLVGTSIIKLMSTNGDVDTTREVAALPEHLFAPAAPSNSSQQLQATGAIAGRIDELSLPDLLQFLSSSRKSGQLSVQSGWRGTITLDEGRVVGATLGEEPLLVGEDAFYKMLWSQSGTFNLEPTADPVPEEEAINAPTEMMVMESMRLLDELGTLGPDVPEIYADLYPFTPLESTLRALTPELLDTFQLVLNHRMVLLILINSKVSDTDTMQDLLYLIRNSYIRTSQD